MKNTVISYVQLLFCSLAFIQAAHATSISDVEGELIKLHGTLGTDANGLLGNLRILQDSLQTLGNTANEIIVREKKYKEYRKMLKTDNELFKSIKREAVIKLMRKEDFTSEADSLAVFGTRDVLKINVQPVIDELMFPLAAKDDNETILEYFTREFALWSNEPNKKTKRTKPDFETLLEKQLSALVYNFSLDDHRPIQTFDCKDHADFIREASKFTTNLEKKTQRNGLKTIIIPENKPDLLITRAKNNNPIKFLLQKISPLLTEALKEIRISSFKIMEQGVIEQINSICKPDTSGSTAGDDSGLDEPEEPVTPIIDEPLFSMEVVESETVLDYFIKEFTAWESNSAEKNKDNFKTNLLNQLTAFAYNFSSDNSRVPQTFNCRNNAEFIKEASTIIKNICDKKDPILPTSILPNSPLTIFLQKAYPLINNTLKTMHKSELETQKTAMTNQINTICKPDVFFPLVYQDKNDLLSKTTENQLPIDLIVAYYSDMQIYEPKERREKTDPEIEEEKKLKEESLKKALASLVNQLNNVEITDDKDIKDVFHLIREKLSTKIEEQRNVANTKIAALTDPILKKKNLAIIVLDKKCPEEIKELSNKIKPLEDKRTNLKEGIKKPSSFESNNTINWLWPDFEPSQNTTPPIITKPSPNNGTNPMDIIFKNRQFIQYDSDDEDNEFND